MKYKRLGDNFAAFKVLHAVGRLKWPRRLPDLCRPERYWLQTDYIRIPILLPLIIICKLPDPKFHISPECIHITLLAQINWLVVFAHLSYLRSSGNHGWTVVL